MTDVHCHVRGGEDCREIVIGEDFLGMHPWDAKDFAAEQVDAYLVELREKLVAEPRLGVGEIGLDRLKDREIPQVERELFERQLSLGVELGRPITLHGAKCWGQVVTAVKAALAAHPASGSKFLFHGFSRSAGLIPDIRALGGFISVGPAVLNDHAVNYRELVKAIPDECLVLETDRTAENAAELPPLRAVLEATAALRGVSAEFLESQTDANAERLSGKINFINVPLTKPM